MNRNIKSKKHLVGLLGVAVLGVGATLSATPASAASRDVKEAKQDVKQARKEVKQEQKDLRQADTRAERKDAREDVQDARQDLREERQDLKQEKREDRQDNHAIYNNRPAYSYPAYNRPVYNNGYTSHVYNSSAYNNFSTFTGTVVNVDGNNQNQMDVRVNGTTFNVYSTSRIPGQVNRGDIVRIYGVRSGSNDIRNANVSLIDNR